MPIIAMNVSSRRIDNLWPQQHREIDAKQAQIYRSILPNEIKIIEVGVETDASSAPLETASPQEVVVEETSTITSDESVQTNEETFDDNRVGDLIGEGDEGNEAPLSIEEAFGESEAI